MISRRELGYYGRPYSQRPKHVRRTPEQLKAQVFGKGYGKIPLVKVGFGIRHKVNLKQVKRRLSRKLGYY